MEAIEAATNGFLSTPSARRATLQRARSHIPACNFYPRPPRGGRPPLSSSRSRLCNFYPRPPRGGRPPSKRLKFYGKAYFYPRPPRGGRLSRCCSFQKSRADFYPRPPRGGRLDTILDSATIWLFLSTPSARRATAADPLCGLPLLYFYPRPPRGGRRRVIGDVLLTE